MTNDHIHAQLKIQLDEILSPSTITRLGGGSQKMLMQYEPAFSIDEEFAKTVLADEELERQSKEREQSCVPQNSEKEEEPGVAESFRNSQTDKNQDSQPVSAKLSESAGGPPNELSNKLPTES